MYEMAVRVFHSLILLIFLVSPLAIYVLRAEFGYNFESLILSYVVTLYCLLPYYIYTFFKIRRRLPTLNMESTFIIIVLPLLMLIATQILLLDMSDLRITREHNREISRLSLFIINLNVVMTAFAIIYFFRIKSRLSVTLLVVCFVLSFVIAVYEGRRAIIVILFGLWALLSLANSASRYQIVLKIVIFSLMLFGLLSVVTIARTSGNIEDLFLVIRAVLTRIFNPGWMMLHVLDNAEVNHIPELGRTVSERVQYVLGLTTNYRGSGNAFGRDYGFLSASNFVVGINPGIVVEAYLWSALTAPLIICMLLICSELIIRLWATYSPNLAVLVSILCVHGYQMEIGYTVGLLIRLFIVGALIFSITLLLPKKKHA